MWYCYLQQDLLDSSFYRLEDTYLRLKSRDVMRFVMGYYSERLQELEIRLEKAVDERTTKLGTAAQIEQFLREFGHESIASLQSEIDRCNSELQQAQAEIQRFREGHLPEKHMTDSLREELRRLSADLGKEETSERDLKERISEDDALRAELLSAKFKLARADAATAVLGGVNFERCPACGTELGQIEGRRPGACKLCGQPPRQQPADAGRRSDVINRDLTSRIEELNEALRQHRAGLRRQTQRVARLRDRKQQLDRRLADEMREYDSIVLAGLRDLERSSATLEERARHLRRIKEMLGSVERLRQEADALQGTIESLRREIVAEKRTLTNADQCITELEGAYHEALMKVGVPGVHAEDEVHIDRTSWRVYIWPHGDEALRWDFSNAGSGGKKTLLNVCYALAVHRVASARNLPLPRFLMIDTPMKNIGEDVNQDLFVRFYRYLYELASTALGDTQFVIVDKEFIEPAGLSVDVIHRFMTPDDNDHPPLISYYRGA
jgi:predicted  nucleic acid-binding Zn-ribbon protein